MENICKKVVAHPQFIETLFAFKSKINHVFNDVLGIHHVNHIAIARVDFSQKISAFSSTPAIEFNLFTSNLWNFDKAYDPMWYGLCTQAPWQSLYKPSHYDELYYTKQTRHHFPITLSLASRQNDNHYIFSIASKRVDGDTQELFQNHHDDFYKIGHYCLSLLAPLFPD